MYATDAARGCPVRAPLAQPMSFTGSNFALLMAYPARLAQDVVIATCRGTDFASAGEPPPRRAGTIRPRKR
jgi:hypothetical protein